MFWVAGSKLAQGVQAVLDSKGAAETTVLASVMGATDSLLFALVLLILAYTVTFGFVLELSQEMEERLPAWMRVTSIGELKRRLVEVILVYLVVDFATDVVQRDAHLGWESLILPIAVILIAGALRLMSEQPFRS